MIQRSYTYRLYPSNAQSVVLTEMLGAFCDLDNAALQQRIEAYRRQHKTLGYFDQSSELKAVRAVDERLAHSATPPHNRCSAAWTRHLRPSSAG